MAEALGSIWTEFRLRLDKLQDDINQAQAQLRQGHTAMEKLQQESTDRMARSTQNLSESFKKVGGTVTVAGATIATGLGFAVKTAADFEKELSNAKAVSGATSEEMAKLKQAASNMSAQTAFSAGEAAQAITELAKGGMSTAEILGGGLKAALDLAAAGELSMGEAAEYVIKTMSPFGLKASEAGKVADLLAGAANASATDVKEMGLALSQTASVASQMGLSLSDTTTTLALFANKGLAGSDAGTSLKTMLMRLVPSTKEATVAMGELGLITEDGKNKFFDANGNLKSMSEIAGLLQGSLKGLTAEQQQMVLQTVFGSDAIRAASIVAESGAAGFDKTAASIGKVSAADVASEKLNNLSGVMEQLKGSVETAMIFIGDAFVPIIHKVAKVITAGVNVFNSLPAPVQKAIAVFAALVAGIALVIGPILMLLGFIPSIVAGFGMVSTVIGALGPVFAALAGPIGIAIAAIAAAIAIGVLLYKNWDSIKAFLINAWNAIKSAAETVLNNLKTFISNTWNSIKTNTETIWNAVKSFLVNWWPILVGLLAGPIGILVALIIKNWDSIKANTIAVWNNIKSAVSNTVGEVRSTIITGLEKAWSYIKGLPSQAYNWGKNIIRGLIDGLMSLVSTLWRKVEDIVNGIKRRIEEALKIGSPSKVTMEYGQAIGQGLLEGLKATKAGDLIASMMKGMIPRTPLTAAYATGVGQAQAQAPAQGTAAAVVNNFYAPLVQPGQLVVRNDQDIERINQDLYEKIQNSARSKGVILGV